MEANIKYDLNCCVRNDSDKNETERSDEDIWDDNDENDDDREEPTFYDSKMWAGNSSFDHHNETD